MSLTVRGHQYWTWAGGGEEPPAPPGDWQYPMFQSAVIRGLFIAGLLLWKAGRLLG